MKRAIQTIAWAVASLTIVYAAFNPESGVAYQSPGAALSIGLIGLGLCLEGRKRLGPTPSTTAAAAD